MQGPLRGRLMVGRLTLDQVVGVRVPAPQLREAGPSRSPLVDRLLLDLDDDEAVGFFDDAPPGAALWRVARMHDPAAIGVVAVVDDILLCPTDLDRRVAVGSPALAAAGPQRVMTELGQVT